MLVRFVARIMRSIVDWLSDFYGPERNPYLRLSDADRARSGIRTRAFVVAVAAFFALWRLLRVR